MANNNDDTIRARFLRRPRRAGKNRPDGLGKPGGGSDESGVKTPSTQYDYSQRPSRRK